MRRILVVDDDPHTRLAIGAWLKQCAALNESTLDPVIVHVSMPNISRESENTG